MTDLARFRLVLKFLNGHGLPLHHKFIYCDMTYSLAQEWEAEQARLALLEDLPETDEIKKIREAEQAKEDEALLYYSAGG